MDHGLVHQSPQFVGENPRLVLGVTLIPKEQPIQLVERTDGRSLQANELTDVAFERLGSTLKKMFLSNR